jgi:hypothetical protein
LRRGRRLRLGKRLGRFWRRVETLMVLPRDMKMFIWKCIEILSMG